MPRILIVDDDTSFLRSLVDALSGEDYDVSTATDGVEAVEILRQQSVDLVVTDLKMPRMGGIELIGQIVNMPGFIPCIVMSAYGTPELEQNVDRRGALAFIDKPIDVGSLRRLIREILERRPEGGFLKGLTLPSFLQLLAIERKTCTVKVSRNGDTGIVFFRKGVLLDAFVGDEYGLEAAYELLSWDSTEIAIQDGCRVRRRAIEIGLEGLLLEAMRRRDEGARGATGSAATDFEKGKEEAMNLESYLNDFKDIKGYLASGIMDFTGDLLANHSASGAIDLNATGAVFNDILRSAHEASQKIGLEACKGLMITTPKGVVVMECSGTDATAHLHFIVVLERGGNQALARVTLDKIIPQVVATMS